MAGKVWLLPQDQAYAWFPEVWAHVGTLCQSDPIGRISEQALMDDLIAGRKQAWLGAQGAFVDCVSITEIEDAPEGRKGNILWTAGVGLVHLQDFMTHFENYALLNGCKSIESCGRPGWQRLLKKLGYSTIRIVIQKDL